MHGNDSTTSTDRNETHRRRLPLSKAVALLSSALLAGASLTLTAPQAGAAVADPGAATAAPAASA
ncbi:hypothetical protein, partial [Streptomyces sp. NPDC058677]